MYRVLRAMGRQILHRLIDIYGFLKGRFLSWLGSSHRNMLLLLLAPVIICLIVFTPQTLQAVAIIGVAFGGIFALIDLMRHDMIALLIIILMISSIGLVIRYVILLRPLTPKSTRQTAESIPAHQVIIDMRRKERKKRRP
jgi:hypothetical protein